MPSKSAIRAGLAGLLLGAGVLGCQASPEVEAMPRYIRDFFTNPNFVVNAPVVHELLGTARGAPAKETRQARFRLPPGFVLEVFATGIPIARYLVPTPTGDLIVSQPRKGRVLLLERDRDGDGVSDGRRVLLGGLNLPHGVELVGDRLFVAGPAYIDVVRFDVARGVVVGEPERLADLPDTSGHAWRPLRLGPDGLLYTAIGADCNVCEPGSEREQAILRFDPASGREEIVARGFRNAAHFDWQPQTDAMFATEVGADYLGEDLPREELNRIEPGGFYGFPYVHGTGLRDPELARGREDRIARATPPAHTFTAHSTPLGIVFLRDPRLPGDYRGAALVVLKGSWNRRRKSGYQIVSLHWVGPASSGGSLGARIEQREFLTGFERDEHVIGRPVDVVEASDGAIFVSDDMAGAIYRIHYDPSAQGRAPSQNENTFAVRQRPARSASSGLEGLDLDVRADLSERGETLYARHRCGECHDASDDRAAAVPITRERLEHHSIAGLQELLRTPPASMPRMLLTDGERRALAVFLLERS